MFVKMKNLTVFTPGRPTDPKLRLQHISDCRLTNLLLTAVLTTICWSICRTNQLVASYIYVYIYLYIYNDYNNLMTNVYLVLKSPKIFISVSELFFWWKNPFQPLKETNWNLLSFIFSSSSSVFLFVSLFYFFVVKDFVLFT